MICIYIDLIKDWGAEEIGWRRENKVYRLIWSFSFHNQKGTCCSSHNSCAAWVVIVDKRCRGEIIPTCRWGLLVPILLSKFLATLIVDLNIIFSIVKGNLALELWPTALLDEASSHLGPSSLKVSKIMISGRFASKSLAHNFLLLFCLNKF